MNNADTIRHYLSDEFDDNSEAFHALDALLADCDESLTALRNEKWKAEAERQQAQEEAERYKAAWEGENRDLRRANQARRQAIDALREIAAHRNMAAGVLARDVLAQLGEKP